MSEFRLQQFSVKQAASAMKVCADSLLFGTLIPTSGRPVKALDIGAGTGLLSLMVAQRSDGSNLQIDAVELMPESAAEATENFLASPWSKRLTCHFSDVRSFANSHTQNYQLIFSNPPFFQQHSKTAVTDRQSELRRTARHTDSLSYQELCDCASALLVDQGLFSVLIPSTGLADFLKHAGSVGFECQQLIEVCDSPEHAAKVVVINLRLNPERTVDDEPERISIIRFQRPNEHSTEVKALLADFLLRYDKNGPQYAERN
jgi:tRNA1Val (adenine37-N6)-methyltransferase